MFLNEDEYYDKVYGCWLGKNCGGTLGTPLEGMWGKEELFDVWWYPRIVEGGIPNDDLELQLIWLQALEDRGLDIKARDLARYWLDCIQYNFDEYGLHKTNLRKGLLPPISGYFNNWFKHCMGSPIRSEIWACIAPGLPDVAASYAYEDAIVDHAGGESVYGEMFNAAMQSAAFVTSDKEKLLEIGLSFIPENCETAKAIRNAIKAYKDGLNWKDARNFVLKESYSPIAQYSPVNLGFQTIGLLYGEDFGDAICKAVNCGYDTDCTGATVGALLGIILGKDGIPKKWVEPLSDRIATNSSWEGIKNVREPRDLDELTKRVCRIGKQIMALHGNSIAGQACQAELTRLNGNSIVLHGDMALTLEPGERTRMLWSAPPTRVDFDLGTLTVSIDYVEGPAISTKEVRKVDIILRNATLTMFEAEVSLLFPEGWEVSPLVQRVLLEPNQEARRSFAIRVCTARALDISNRGSVRIRPAQRPQVEDVPIVFVGANKWLVSERFDGDIDTILPAEENAEPSGVGEGWIEVNFPENELKIEGLFKNEPGVIYLRHYVHSPSSRPVWVGLPSTCPFKLWLNGNLICEARGEGILRPNYGGDGRSYADATLREGWNQFFVKIARTQKPVEAHFVISTGDRFHHGLSDLIGCKFPWEI